MKIIFALLSLLLLLQDAAFQSVCEENIKLKDNISDEIAVVGVGHYVKCWKILNPSRYPVRIKVDYLNFKLHDCKAASTRVTINNQTYRFCEDSAYNKKTIIGNTDVVIEYIVWKNVITNDEILSFQLSYEIAAFQSLCEEKTRLKDKISEETALVGVGHYIKCWKISNPIRYPVTLKVDYLNFNSYDCNAVNISVTINNNTYGFCNNSPYNKDILIGNTDVFINYTARNNYIYGNNMLGFQLSYEIETGIHIHPRVNETRLNLISSLNNTWSSVNGWRENTARAIVALYLSGGATFNGARLNEELVAKQVELKTATALLRQPISNERLSMFINALLVTCNNPRRFYGHNLVKLLKDQVTSSRNFTHPLAYLTLCNANETWPSKAIKDLTNILNSDYKYPFMKDYQAFAIMALSCYGKNNNSFEKYENGTLKLKYERAVKEMKEHQLADGSFGNVHSTALIAQAIISNVVKNATKWNPNATLEFLIKELNSSKVDLVSIMLSLPVLNGKSFIDIAKVNCSNSNRRQDDDDLVSDINDNLGPKMRIQYSLYIGENKDIIHTIYFRVPENFTAYEVMRLAEAEDPKYKFDLKRIKKDVYIYRIGNLMNDPEVGTFWLQYLHAKNDSHPRSYALTAPDHLRLEDEDHLIMWYRKPTI